MARKSRQARPAGKQGGRQGGGFLRGLALGLAVAAGVQVYHAGLPDWFGGSGGDSADPAARIEPSKTNFDFYRLLPKTEVRVGEPAAPGGAVPPPAPAERTAPRPSTATPRPSTAASGRKPPEPAVAPAPTPAPTPTPAPASASREYRVQAGSFREKKEADRLRASLALGGFESRIQTRDTAGGTRHRVMLGPFRGRDAAEAAKARLRAAQGIDALIVR